MNRLNILYDARFLQPKTRHWGVGVVIDNIVGRLAGQFRFVGLSQRFEGNGGQDLKFWPSLSLANRLVFEVSPLLARGCDLYWATTHFLPQFVSSPSVLTVYDMLLLNRIEKTRVAPFFASRFRSALKRATKVLPISKTTADDLIAEFPGLKTKIEVVHLGFDVPEARIEASEPKMDIPSSPYAMMLGCHRPRKNLPLALATIRKLRERGISIKLIITGYVYASFRGMLGDCYDDVREFGVVPKQAIFQLLQNATCLFYPSLYEGFGLPLLEAMAAQCPVIALDIPINREIAGEAAFLLPDDAGKWAAICEQLLKSDALRREMQEKGLKNLVRFSWDRTAASYSQVFKEAVRQAR